MARGATGDLRRLTRRLTRATAERLGAWRARGRADRVELDAVRRRLELLLTMLHGRAVYVAAAPDPAARGWAERLFDPTPRLLRPRGPSASVLGDRVLLPASLPANGDAATAVAHYRLLALGQAERLVRGTAALLPNEDAGAVRSLYLLSEGVAADRAIATGGTAPLVRAARARALAARPPLGRLAHGEREVELLLRRVLASDPAAPPAELPAAPSPADSLRWARETAAALAPAGARYRGLAPVEHWGAPPNEAGRLLSMGEQVLGAGLIPSPTRRSTLGGSDALPEGAVPQPDAQETAGDAGDAGAPPNESGAPEEAGGDEPGAGTGASAAGDVDPVTGALLPAGTAYPEWDEHEGRWRAAGAVVRAGAAAEADGAWAAEVLAAHAPLVTAVRQRFERLRARRLRLARQRDGDELDLPACVEALVARRAGLAVDDRLYAATRPSRRGLAILLLVDVSGSTEAPVSESAAGDALRVVDVERVAALLAAAAFDALGDRYAILAFSGLGAHNVRVATLKGFDERDGDRVRRRVSAVAPDGNTRLGAAVRHAAALLAREDAGHRLLIVLSDGRPNDMDRYQGPYAVEDARRAVLEARASGVRPFCLTVDREDPEYLARIFGETGYTMVRHPDHVPGALLALVRQLVAG